MQGGKRLTDEQAEDLLLLVRGKVTKFVGRSRRQEELRRELCQKAFERILARLSLFDPAKGSLATFAATVVDSILVEHLRHRYAAKRDVRREIGTVDAILGGPNTQPIDLKSHLDVSAHRRNARRTSQHLAEVLDFVLDLSAAMHHLSAEDRRFIERLKSYSVAEIAEQDGVCRGTGYRRWQTIRKRLENNGLRKYFG